MGMGIPISIPNIVNSQGLKKNLEEKQKEKKRIYSYIGMEVCDLCQDGKLTVPQIDVYMEKLQAVDQEIADLEAKLAGTRQARQKIQLGARCICGNYLKPGAKFCPRCGKPAETEVLVCTCGCKIGKGVRFCQNCGKKVSELTDLPVESAQASSIQKPGQIQPLSQSQAGAESAVGKRECICGAIVPSGQTMCMECGRIVPE
ncbi:MAG: hypothetical protein HFH35_00390 [Eubacterium sp.]|nr:hypothetical protein [Eubacterium sp.]